MKDKNAIIVNIRRAFEKLSTPLDLQKVQNDKPLQETYGIDSITLMEFMILIEEELDMEFDEDFKLEYLDSIDSIADYLMNHEGLS